MAGLDPVRLSRTLTYLLRHGLAGAGLHPDPDGWVTVADTASAATRAIRRPVAADDILLAATRYGGGRFELGGERIRAAPNGGPANGAPAAPLNGGPANGGERPPPNPGGPDILYHAAPRSMLDHYREGAALAAPQGGPVHLARTESQAWRVGHRQWEDPTVFYVDACRARREGQQFCRTRIGQYFSDRVPLRYVLNLREGFAEQTSAGGFLVDWSSGLPRIALIRVIRRSSATWEVAKGKLEAGEAPDVAAVRELREEMGVEAPLHVSRPLGTVRYGFSTPEGDPRLKTIYLYIIEVDGAIDAFTPSRREGIEAVRWFSVEEAVHALTHPSLRASIGRLMQALGDRAAELGLAYTG